MTRLSSRSTLLMLALLLGASPALADQIHLRNGGQIQTDHWWTEGESLFYESPAGSVGIPLSLVLRIDPSVDAPAAAEPDEGRPEAAPERPRPTAALSAGAPNELHEWMAQGTDAFQKRDFESASAAFEKAWTAQRELSSARVGFALSEISLGRDARALSCVLEGLSIDPGSAELHEIMGDLENRDERVDEALRSWREAFRLSASDRVREKILRAERELLAGRDYAFSAAPHFTLRFDGSLDPTLTEQITDFLESSYRQLAQRFRHAPPQPITVLLYPERQFRDVTQAPDEIGGVFDGKIRVPLGGLAHFDSRAQRLLVHELTHAFVSSKTRGNCPRWLHEGLAQIAEGRVISSPDRAAVIKLLRERGPTDWDGGSFSYPAALSLTLYLESLRGETGLAEILDRLEDGAAIDPALAATYNKGYEELCGDWEAAVVPPAVRR